MDPAALTPAGDTHLGKQLDTSKDSTKRSGESQGAELETVGLDNSVDKLQLASPKLSEAQAGLCEDFGPLARPLIRPLKIYNLPDELLVEIFGYLRDLADIKHLRLCSKRLNETSSHLLMYTLHVSPNPKSLERLDKLSRHPTISRGIRHLVASVDVYNAEYASDMVSFAIWCIEVLGQVVLPERSPGGNAALRVRRSWVAFVDKAIGIVYNGGLHLGEHLDEHLDEHHVSAVSQGWLRYRRLHYEQRAVIRSGRFCQGIASAVGRMACLSTLVIRDRSRSCAGEQLRSPGIGRKAAELAADPTRLVEEMMLHTFSWENARTRGDANPPTQLLYQIPLAIHNAGYSLAHLRFDLTPPRSFRLGLSGDEMSQLRSLARGLKSFKFRVGPEPRSAGRPIRDAQESEDLHKFLIAFTRPEKLGCVALDLAFQERYYFEPNRPHHPGRTSIGRLLVDWHQPQSIHLKNCSIALKELRTFVDLPRDSPAVLGFWHVYLLDGTWADALEHLRSGVLSGKLSQQSYVRCPYGAECLTMSKAERKRTFYERCYRHPCKDSVVNCYIKGHEERFVSNPLRDQDSQSTPSTAA